MPTRTLAIAALLTFSMSLAGPARAEWPHGANSGGVNLSASSGSQINPLAIPDGAGGAFVAWEDGFSTWVQRVSADGVPLWTPGGVLAFAGTGRVLVSDGSGGVIVAGISGEEGAMLVSGQRLDALGAALWTAGGKSLSGSSYLKADLRCVPDGAGGAILVWKQAVRIGPNLGPFTTRVSRINSAGTAQWGASGVTNPGESEPTYSALTTDGASGAILGWVDARSGLELLYAQRWNSSGVAQWGTGGVQIGFSSGGTIDPAAVSDGAGGAILAYLDYSASGGLRMQRVTGSGSTQWTLGGVVVNPYSNNPGAPRLVADGFGGAIVAWADGRGGTLDIYAQRVTAAGGAMWTSNGVPLTTASGVQTHHAIASDGLGGCVVAWYDGRNGVHGDLYVRRVEAGGSLRGDANGSIVSGAADTQDFPSVATVGGGASIVTWHDSRAGHADIYALRMDEYLFRGDARPRIRSVRDVPNDQGGKVRVEWTASYLDTEPDPGLIFDYQVTARTPTGTLVWVASVPAGPLPQYSVVMPTLADSVPGNANRLVFEVKAWPYGLASSWTSPADSGCSVDNLSPLTPEPQSITQGGGETRLEWTANTEADLAGYHVHRGATADFAPSAATRLATTTSPSFVDATASVWIYKVIAVDTHGNESAPLTLVPAGSVGVEELAMRAVALAAPRPNPASRMAALAFTLPQASPIELVVLDLSGRVVREIARAPFAAGEHRFEWDLRDHRGTRVAPGIFYVRMTAGAALVTRAVAVVR